MEDNHLDIDPPIHNQLFVCLSFCFPELIKNCNIRAIKCRGVYNDIEKAKKRCIQIQDFDKNFPVFVGEMGKWLAFNPQTMGNDSNTLNKVIEKYKNAHDLAETSHIKRKDNMLLSANRHQTIDIDDKNKAAPAASNEIEDFEIEEDLTFNFAEKEITHIENQQDDIIENREVDLENDPKLPEQIFVCYSFCPPDGLLNTPVFGIKVRGIFETKEEATKLCNTLRDIDKYFDIYIGEVGKWYNCAPSIDECEETIYRENKLNDIIKAQKNKNTLENIKPQESKRKLVESMKKKLKKNTFEQNINSIKKMINEKNK